MPNIPIDSVLGWWPNIRSILTISLLQGKNTIIFCLILSMKTRLSITFDASIGSQKDQSIVHFDEIYCNATIKMQLFEISAQQSRVMVGCGAKSYQIERYIIDIRQRTLLVTFFSSGGPSTLPSSCERFFESACHMNKHDLTTGCCIAHQLWEFFQLSRNFSLRNSMFGEV